MRVRKARFAAGFLALLTLLASCSDDTDGPLGGDPPPVVPTPSASAPSGSGTALPHSGAPKVTTPIADTSAWESDPCSAITVEQLSGVGLKVGDPQREDVPDLGPGCLWEVDADQYIAVSNGLGSVNREGLSTVYKNNEAGAIKVFEVLPPVEGHPAVIAEAEDLRSEGECGVAVGLRDDMALTVAVQADTGTEQGKDPCGWAAKLAALAVQTMKGSA